MLLFIEASSNFMLNHSLTAGSPPTFRVALESDLQPTSTTLIKRTLPAHGDGDQHNSTTAAPPPAPSEGPSPSGPPTHTFVDNTGREFSLLGFRKGRRERGV